MAIIKTQTAETATGKVKEFYDGVLKIMPMIPKPLQLASASPNLFAITSQQMKYFMSHPTLGPLLQAYIRMLVAFNTDYPYCIELNTNVLKMMGKLNDEQIVAARKDPDKAQLSDKDKALLKFVVKAVSAPEEIQAQDVDVLRQIGWNDSDIFDAAVMGTNMVAMGMLFNIFKMHEAC
jgi:alkylhydroperoxidase family enzyme